jgi:hypothetical protein
LRIRGKPPAAPRDISLDPVITFCSSPPRSPTPSEHASTRTGHHTTLALVEHPRRGIEEIGELLITDVRAAWLQCPSYTFMDK